MSDEKFDVQPKMTSQVYNTLFASCFRRLNGAEDREAGSPSFLEKMKICFQNQLEVFKIVGAHKLGEGQQLTLPSFKNEDEEEEEEEEPEDDE